MAKKKVEEKQEPTQAELRAAEEQILLSWVLSQILANDLFTIAESTIAKSASIAYQNKMTLAINTSQKKDATKFMKEIHRTATEYRTSAGKILGFISKSPRYENVVKYALEKMTEASGVAIKEALEKYPK